MSNWYLLLLSGLIVHLVAAFMVAARVIVQTRSPAKALAYLILIFLVPVFGICFFYLIGINYRKRKLYSKKLRRDQHFFSNVKVMVKDQNNSARRLFKNGIEDKYRVAHLLMESNLTPVNANSRVRVLVNGEEKYPVLLKALEAATSHIHMEYYIFKCDDIGKQVQEVLIRKAQEGVKVRIIYDAFGSQGMRGKFVREMRDAGIEIFAFYRLYLPFLARRTNYRNHRKIVVIDGKLGFTGGINISNDYSNAPGIAEKNEMYWRDTHAQIEGTAVHSMQYLFLATWNFCSDQQLTITNEFFPQITIGEAPENEIVQIAASGPDSPHASIFLSFLAAIASANREIRITTPYFIPNLSLVDALKTASLSGISVELLVPYKSDTWIADLAARSYFEELMDAGVRIYFYKKGLVHAKTMTVDGNLSIIGTANMDMRSFDFNFEVNAVIYGEKTNRTLQEIFLKDLEDSIQVDPQKWKKRTLFTKARQAGARLFSSLL